MYKEAERVLREATKHLPNDPLLYYTLGVLLGRINRLQVQSWLLVLFIIKFYYYIIVRDQVQGLYAF